MNNTTKMRIKTEPNREFESLAEFITNIISERIIRNELKPGERILETQIAKELQVSRSPVREALRILEKNRLIDIIPRRGARVTEITTQHVHWFYETYEALYIMAARLAILKACDQELQIIWKVLDKIKDAAQKKDTQAYYEAIFEYAATGVALAKNPLLEQLIMELWPSNRRFQYVSLMDRDDDLQKNACFFQKLTKAMQDREITAAEQILRQYAENEKKFILRVIRKK